MRKFRFIASLLLALCASMTSTIMAQGYGMYVDGNFVSLQEGDSVLFTGAEPQSAQIVVMRDGQIRANMPGGQVTFFGDVETYFQKVPASLLDIWDFNYHYAFGYPAEMIVRDILTADSHYDDMGYNWFASWESNKSQGRSYVYSHFLWVTYQNEIAAANKLIGAINPETATDVQKGYLGVGLTYRALCYLDIARMYEYLPNDATYDKNIFGENLTHLTVPIVTEKTTAEQAANNPRATRMEMAKFIESDLEAAEQYIVHYQGNITMPNLAAVYGLKARLYMWIEDYAKAETYARMAIKASTVKPISEAEALNTKTGYNLASQFMWAAQQDIFSSDIISWISWISNQTDFGYTGSATNDYLHIDRKMYDRISNTDWRKKQWVAPRGSVLRGQNIFMNEEQEWYMPDYASLKFRPGEGNVSDGRIGSITAVPLMRVEEMYFIEAEAAAHQDAKNGQLLLSDFMKTYRDPSYTCDLTGEALIDEIVFQKRVELWGEGQTFFDIKRLNMSVTRSYDGTNFPNGFALNTQGRPAWMNIVFPDAALNGNLNLIGNTALLTTNNPNPSELYAIGGGLAQKKMDHTEVLAWYVDAPMKELLGLPTPLNYHLVSATSTETAGVIRLEYSFEYLKKMGVEGLLVNDDNGLNIQVIGGIASIPLQSIGCTLNGMDIKIASTKDGVMKNNTITFPANAITMYVGTNDLMVVNSKAQFELAFVEKKPEVFVSYNQYYTKASEVITRDGQPYLRQRVGVNIEGETKDVVRAVLVPYSQGDDALMMFLQDENYGILQGEDGYLELPVPAETYLALCYAVYRNGVVVSTRKTTVIYPDYKISMYEDLNAEKTKWMVHTNFAPQLDQAYVAVVTDDMDKDAIQQAFEQGKLKYLYETKINQSNVSEYQEIPVPEGHGLYRLVGIGLRGGKVVNVGYDQYYAYNSELNDYVLTDTQNPTTFELPCVYELSVKYQEKTKVDGGTEVKFTLSADSAIAYTKVAVMEADVFARYGTVYEAMNYAQYITTCPASGAYSITLPAQELKSYVLLAVAYEQDGSIAKSFNTNIGILNDDYVPYAYGMYYSDFWGEEWEEVLEYSPSLNTYRISGWWTGNQGFTFTWDKESNNLTMGASKIPTGMPYGDYGEVSAITNDVRSQFIFIPKADENSSDVFRFDFSWSVSAGSFGIYPEYFTVTRYADQSAKAERHEVKAKGNRLDPKKLPTRELLP